MQKDSAVSGYYKMPFTVALRTYVRYRTVEDSLLHNRANLIRASRPAKYLLSGL
jgi:hypothetical protein